MKVEILRDFDSIRNDKLPSWIKKSMAIKDKIEFKWGDVRSIQTEANKKLYQIKNYVS